MLKYLFSTLFIIIVLAFKPITTYFIEVYTSSLIHQKVKVTSLTIVPLKAEGYIRKNQNKISINIVKIFPLMAKANYNGNIDAFSIYHPLKGHIVADANITYDDKLIVDANALLYKSKFKILVKELKQHWYISLNTKDLDLNTLKKQNNKKIDIDAKIDLNLKLTTSQNTSLNISTKNLNISNQSIENVNIKLLWVKNKFHIKSSFKPLDFNKISLKTDVNFKNNYIKGSANINFNHTNIYLKRLKINTKNMQTAIDTPSFGGNLNVVFKNSFLYFKADSLQLSKILKILQQNNIASGRINLKGKLNTENLTSDLTIDSPQITISKQKIKNISLNIPNLQYTNKSLKSSYKIDGNIFKQKINLSGNLNYKNTIKLTAKSYNYDGESTFYLNNKKFKFHAKNLDIKKLLAATNKKNNISGLLNIDANGNFEKINFKTSLKLKKEDIHINGKATFKDHFILTAHNRSFDSNTILTLDDKHFKLYIKNLNLEKLTSNFESKKTLYGNINLKAEGTFDNMVFSIDSQHIQNSMQLDKISNYISLNLHGKYKKNYLYLKNNVALHYKNELIPLKLKATIYSIPPYNSKLSLTGNQDKVLIKSFSYDNNQIKSDFTIDIKDLYKYRILTSNELHGPILIKGYYKDALYIKTNSFGGELKANLKKNDFKMRLNNLKMKKVFSLIKKGKMFEYGAVNGDINYNIHTDTGKSNISVLDTLVKGGNLDKQLSSLDDILGLNVVNISKSFVSKFKNKDATSTYIKHLELDMSLKNKKIYLDDVAMSTKKFRIVALGNLQRNGDIDKLSLNIIDKKGCAVLTQDLKGNIKNPQISRTTTAISLVEKVPSSILKTGKGIIDFSGKTLDKITSFGIDTIFRTDKNISIVSNTISKSSSILNSGEKIILKECRVIYDKKVKHPKGD